MSQDRIVSELFRIAEQKEITDAELKTVGILIDTLHELDQKDIQHNKAKHEIVEQLSKQHQDLKLTIQEEKSKQPLLEGINRNHPFLNLTTQSDAVKPSLDRLNPDVRLWRSSTFLPHFDLRYCTILMVAVGNEHVNLVRLLLEKGANPNIVSLCNRKVTALSLACATNNEAMVKLLLNKELNPQLDPNLGLAAECKILKTQDIYVPLILAIVKNYPSLAELLINDSRVNVNLLVDGTKFTGLFDTITPYKASLIQYAIEKKQHKTLTLLLQREDLKLRPEDMEALSAYLKTLEPSEFVNHIKRRLTETKGNAAEEQKAQELQITSTQSVAQNQAKFFRLPTSSVVNGDVKEEKTAALRS